MRQPGRIWQQAMGRGQGRKNALSIEPAWEEGRPLIPKVREKRGAWEGAASPLPPGERGGGGEEMAF